MGFFDFVGDLPHYAEHRQPVLRLNRRHQFLIEPYAAEIKGSRVLDLASHDGRWPYAFAGAGAAEVKGIEGRAELVAEYELYPETAFKNRVTLTCNDLYDGMEAEIAAGQRYDVIGVFGILYHVMDHFRLFQLAQRLGPKLILVDSEFVLRPGPMIQLVKERTDNILNATPQHPGQTVAIKGVPSAKAMEAMAEALDYDIDWADWDSLPKGQRKAVSDYFRPDTMRRMTCALRPKRV